MKKSNSYITDRVVLGVVLIVLAVFMMSIQDGVFKYFSADFTLWQVFTLRGMFAIPLICVVAVFWRKRQKTLFKESFSAWVMARSILMTLMFICMYASTPLISLSTIAAGIYTAPIFVTLLSAWLIKEKVSRQGWVAIIAGFIGVLIILKPGTDVFSYWAVLPLIGGLLYALSNVITRAKCQSCETVSLAMSLNLALLTTGIIFSLVIIFLQPKANLLSKYPYLFADSFAIDGTGWAVIVLLAIFAVSIGLGLAGAYQVAPAATIATFDYSYLVFVTVWDILFFDHTPGKWSIIGMLIIVGAGVLVSNQKPAASAGH